MFIELFKIIYFILISSILFSSAIGQTWNGLFYIASLIFSLLFRNFIFLYSPTKLGFNEFIDKKNDLCYNKDAYFYSNFVNTQSIFILCFTLFYAFLPMVSGSTPLNIIIIILLTLLLSADIGIKYINSCGNTLFIFMELLFAAILAILFVFLIKYTVGNSYLDLFSMNVKKLNDDGTVCDRPNTTQKMKCRVYKNGKLVQ